VLLLCGDSTNADRPGFAQSESDIGPALFNVFRGCEGRIVVTSFASNIIASSKSSARRRR
jgi:ribonuclease J